nr:GAP family protein [Leucobacter weissii]
MGIAISPIPVIATILMLLSPEARRTSIGFLLGWTAGIIVAVVVFTLLSSILPAEQSDATRIANALVKLVLGALLLLLAVRQWRGRPRGGAEPKLPKWMSAIDTMTAGRAALLAFALAAINPKNLLLAASAGILLGQAASAGAAVAAIAVFVVIAASTVAAPVVAYLAASSRMTGVLESLRAWLVRNNTTIMTILLLVMGVSVIGKGIAAF